ncbi:helix-turn-helix transcriptional regulator [Elizabethkingia anophelis]|uniref:HxlR family transcriptional regulator n=3 Tax=Elizabethkingia TaxID=308865 RepID=A0ABD4DNQ0_ELIMR|nr:MULTISPECIES: helix-turn-helix domain-containing protein [Elizabethkingia]AKH94107.1 HxlR family transcriptional regulator [Elizabethkingia anophelis FMS-007]AMR40363.1 HxlR family transcriptional regulator [Elizabethkingia anophelis]AMX46995.1 HxlR family transcriptional regulator [Elizabethkingia anophelis]AMX50458.1 HxlR family transcriptional regulator [Elizabethkingia anophelis]AMX53847.1 HxlR family transcriptional regulator [Elizabethkingia anophelis]
MKKQRTELGPDCKMHLRGVEDTVYLLSGKWKTIIISHLYFAGKMRFMDLKRQLEKVAAKTLSKELKELEMNNLVSRTQNNTMPVTVDYELTDFGKSLHDVIDTMSKWGINYRKELLQNGNK